MRGAGRVVEERPNEKNETNNQQDKTSKPPLAPETIHCAGKKLRFETDTASAYDARSEVETPKT